MQISSCFVSPTKQLVSPSLLHPTMETDTGFKAALEEAQKGSNEGGVPIGAALVGADGRILGRGHNMRIQKNSATLHVGCAVWCLILGCPDLQQC